MTLRALRAQGRILDPSRDYEFKDWNEVRRFAVAYLAHDASKLG